MNLSKGKLFFIAFLVLFLTECKKHYIISDNQTILFQFEYENNAWGYQHYGYFIDNEGNVLKYDNPEDWNFLDNELILSEKHVTENLSKCLLTGTKITKEELQKYTNYIHNIASSKITALKNVAADAGSLQFICYQFSESSETYKGYLIKMEGDFTCENLNFYSKRVVAWMRKINDTISEY